MDEEIYSFRLEEYRSRSASVDVSTPTSFEVESPKTRVLRLEWETQNSIVVHFNDQLNQVKSKQRFLFRALANGFNGDLQRTLGFVAAIGQACRDIEMVEGRISDHTKDAMAKRYDHLSSRNEDLQQVLIVAKEELLAGQDRLERIDSMQRQGIEAEQAMIRLARERITLLERDIQAQAREMNELATVTKKPPDQEGSEPSDSRSRKGKKKAQEKQEGIRKESHEGGKTLASTFVPSVAPSIASPAVMTSVSEELSNDSRREFLTSNELM